MVCHKWIDTDAGHVVLKTWTSHVSKTFIGSVGNTFLDVTKRFVHWSLFLLIIPKKDSFILGLFLILFCYCFFHYFGFIFIILFCYSLLNPFLLISSLYLHSIFPSSFSLVYTFMVYHPNWTKFKGLHRIIES